MDWNQSCFEFCKVINFLLYVNLGFKLYFGGGERRGKRTANHKVLYFNIFLSLGFLLKVYNILILGLLPTLGKPS